MYLGNVAGHTHIYNEYVIGNAGVYLRYVLGDTHIHFEYVIGYTGVYLSSVSRRFLLQS